MKTCKRRLRRLTLALGLAIAGSAVLSTVTGPTAAHAASSVGGAITRTEIISRAQYWFNRGDTWYSQDQSDAISDGTGGAYRPDCSGFVAMTWHLPKKTDGWDFNVKDFAQGPTPSAPGWAGDTRVSLGELLSGDAVVRNDLGHIELFDKWVNPADHSQGIWTYGEHDYGRKTEHDIMSWSYLTSNFYGIRYNKIDNPPPPGQVVLWEGAQALAHDGFTSMYTINASNGHLQESYLSASGQWATQDLSNAAGTPASASQPVAVIHDNFISIYTIDAANGHLQETYWPRTGGSWASQDLGAAAGVPAAQGKPAVGVHGDFVSVYTITAANGHLQESYWTPGASWATQDLSAAAGVPAVSGNPAVAVHGTYVSVYTIDAGSGHVRESYWSPGVSWATQDLTNAVGTPAATASPTAVVHDNFVSIYTVTAANGHLQESYWPQTGGSWSTQDLTTAAGTPASATQPVAIVHDTFVSVYTITAANGHLQESYWPRTGGSWASQDLSTAAGTPAATGTPAAVLHDTFVSVYTVTAANGHLQESYWKPGANWATQDLTNAIGTPAAKP